MADRDPVIRPIGHVESTPVAQRLPGRDVYIGNVLAADNSEHDRDYAYVLSATKEAQPSTTHHHPLVDGPETDWPEFEAAVDTTRTLLDRDGSLLVHCKAGVSRSSTLLATALAANTGTTFRDALGVVQTARPVATPHPALRELGIVYLAAMEPACD